MRGMATRWISRRIQSALSHRKTFPADGICGEWNRQTSAAWHLLYGQYNFSDVLMVFQNSVRIRCVLNGERAVDQRTDCTGFDLRPDLFLQFGKDAPFHIFGTRRSSLQKRSEQRSLQQSAPIKKRKRYADSEPISSSTEKRIISAGFLKKIRSISYWTASAEQDSENILKSWLPADAGF